MIKFSYKTRHTVYNSLKDLNRCHGHAWAPLKHLQPLENLNPATYPIKHRSAIAQPQ